MHTPLTFFSWLRALCFAPGILFPLGVMVFLFGLERYAAAVLPPTLARTAETLSGDLLTASCDCVKVNLNSLDVFRIRIAPKSADFPFAIEKEVYELRLVSVSWLKLLTGKGVSAQRVAVRLKPESEPFSMQPFAVPPKNDAEKDSLMTFVRKFF
jgi:hypothetical protein